MMDEIKLPILNQASSRDVGVLRLLGRLGIVSSRAMARLLFFDPAATSRKAQQHLMQRTLYRLLDRHLLWRMEGPREVVESSKKPGHRLGKQGDFFYGLTHDGRELLGDLGAEPPDVLERLVSRDRRAPLPNTSSLLVDEAISSWCSSVIDHARRTYLLVGMTVQARYAVPDPAKERPQTIGATVSLVFNPKAKPVQRAPWELPWLSGEALDETWRTVSFAVEVDAGLTSTQAILETATTYARLAQAKVYDRMFGSTPRPVVIVFQPNRLGKVTTAWHDAWPGTPAVVTTAKQATHEQYGALWGRYFTLKDDPVQPANLLAGLVSSSEQWARLVAGWGSNSSSEG